jgi:hypothetical protein
VPSGAQPANPYGPAGHLPPLPIFTPTLPTHETPPLPFPLYTVEGFGGGRYTQFRLEKKESLLGCLPLSSPSPSLVLSPARGFLEELRTEGVLHTARGSAPGIRIQKIYFHTLAGSEAGIVVGHHKPTELRGVTLGHLTSYERTSSRP